MVNHFITLSQLFHPTLTYSCLCDLCEPLICINSKDFFQIIQLQVLSTIIEMMDDTSISFTSNLWPLVVIEVYVVLYAY